MKRPALTTIPPMILTLLALAGCGGSLLGPSSNPPSLYRLSAPEDIVSATPAARWQLVVDTPTAPQDLDTSRIAIAPEPARIDYYAGVAWADRAPVMIQELMLESFDKSGKVAAVRQQSNIRPDFLLSTDIRHFEADAAGDPSVHVDISAHLIRARDRAIVATRNFSATAPVSPGFDGTIGAFDQAMRTMLPQIVDWTLTEGDANP